MKLTNLRMASIRPSRYQTRGKPQNIDSLANNIRENGLLSPILVRELPNGVYELVAGTRRLLAYQKLGRIKIPCFVVKMSNVEAAKVCASENLQRNDLTPFEEAKTFLTLREDCGSTQEEISRLVGRSRSYVANSLGLLKMDPFLQTAVIFEKLTVSHTRLIRSIPPEYRQYTLADIAIDWRLTVRELKTIVDSIKKGIVIFSWKHWIPVDWITTDRYRHNSIGDIFVDTAGNLIGGKTKLDSAVDEGERYVEAGICYWLDWLKKDPDSVPMPCTDWVPTSRFGKKLVELVGSPEEVYQRYPVHRYAN